MKKFKIITNNIRDHFHNMIVMSALTYAEVHEDYLKNVDLISESKFLSMANMGWPILRRKNRVYYDSFIGAIFCMGIENDYPDCRFVLAEPEDASYDIAILMPKKTDSIKRSYDTEWYKKQTIIFLEITELVNLSSESINYLAKNKSGPTHDYKGRVLLINVETSGNLDFDELSQRLKIFNVNFKTARLLAKRSSKDGEYFLMDLLTTPLKIKKFDINIDLVKMHKRVTELASQSK